jgi:hypothetical protein
VPTGVITFRRFALPNTYIPLWNESKTELCDLHLTTGKKIEEIKNVLQVNTMIFFIYSISMIFLG